MRKQKLQFFVLALVLVLVAFGYLYARHYAASHTEKDTSPTFEYIETESTEETTEESETLTTETAE